MIKPQLCHNHDLDVVIQVLNFVSFIAGEVIFDLLSLDVVELTDLVKSISVDILEPIAMLLLRQEAKSVVHISQKVKGDRESLFDLSMLEEHAFIA